MAAPPPELRVIRGRERRSVGPAFELAALGAGLTLTMALLARLPSWYHALGTFQSLVAVAFAFYGLALLSLRRVADLPGVGLAVFAVALAARVALLPVHPSLSGDAFRYVWEGRALAHGFDPYRLPPSDPRLVPLRDDAIYPGINHPELSTIYPPLAVFGFALVTRISDGIEAMKLWVVLHDLLVVAALIAWLPRRGVSPAAAIAYAWNPLVLVEYAGSGHNDPTAILWLVVALALSDRRPVLSALALATGVGVKLAPLVALPGLLLRWTWPARIVGTLAVAAVLGVTALLAHGPASGFAAYWSSWRNNELVFHLLERATRRFEVARAIAIGAIAAALVFAVWRRRSPERTAQLGARVATLVTPVLHPWYLGWTLVFEPLTRSLPWILGSATVLMSYGLGRTPAEGRNFHLPLAWRWVEYGIPAIAGLAVLMARRTGRRRRT